MSEREPITTPLSRVEQDHDIVSLYKGIIARVNQELAISEFIDNALDAKLEETKVDFRITFQPDEKRIIITTSGTTGMTPDKMEQFAQFGLFGEQRDPHLQALHGIGAKTATLWWVEDMANGSLFIHSTPPNSKIAYTMNITDWWRNLEPGKKWSREKMQAAEKTNIGNTVFRIENTNKNKQIRSKPSIENIADELGEKYGQLISEGKLKITLAAQRKKERIEVVVPGKTIIFDKETHKTETLLSVQGGVSFNLEWGEMPNIDERKKMAREQAKDSNIKPGKIAPIRGHRVYFFHRGRITAVQHLSAMGVEGYSNRHSLDNFVVKVDITKGTLRRDIYKTGLSPDDPVFRRVRKRVAREIKMDVQRIVAEERPRTIGEIEKAKTREANIVLEDVLKQIFTDPIIMAKAFYLPLSEKQVSDILYEKAGRKQKTLVGTTRKSRTEKSGTVETKKISSVFPKMVPVHAGPESPKARVVIKDDGTTEIELNMDRPSIRLAYKIANNRQSLFILSLIAAEALFARRYGEEDAYELKEVDLADFEIALNRTLEVLRKKRRKK